MNSILMLLPLLCSHAFAQDEQTEQASTPAEVPATIKAPAEMVEVRDPKTFMVLVGTPTFVNAPDLMREESELLCKSVAISLHPHTMRDDMVALCGNDETTRASILSQLTQLRAKLQPGDSVFYIHSGLGVGGDWGDPVLLTNDFSPSEEGLVPTSLSLSEIYETLNVEGVQVAMALDVVSLGSFDIPGVGQVMTLGPIAADAPEGVLSISASSSIHPPDDSALFMRMLANGLDGEADLNNDGAISFDEINRFVVSSLTRDTGAPPGVHGNWKDATQTIVTVQPAPTERPAKIARDWRPSVNPRLRKATWITGGALLAISAGSYALSFDQHACLTDPCYTSEDEYDQVVRTRNAWALAGQVSGGLGLTAMGFGIYAKPAMDGQKAEGAVSMTLTW